MTSATAGLPTRRSVLRLALAAAGVIGGAMIVALSIVPASARRGAAR